MTSQATIPVVVNGACGKMGREVIKAVAQAEDMTLAGAIDKKPDLVGQDIGEVIGYQPLEVPVMNDLEATLVMAQSQGQAVMVDFTHPDTVYESVRAAIAYGVRPVVGTTGLSPEQIRDLAEFADKASIGCLVVPNFSIGVVLMQQAALQAAQYFDHVEIIELHHNQKADAPSGTAVQTAQMLTEAKKRFNAPLVAETETIQGARGGQTPAGIHIHSVRLPGLIAHQE
ncbi:MAG TPA: 4-hydroxy-tetrahydrodipicolinate reductase, partial [Leptolyngbyaceae cyanobacterium M65_K2018_010]|nr:4-hydroxy-tetrahydrodipicolinate reductase [Leptolyngbyaceae cyanobacterium M65_K2018_010]